MELRLRAKTIPTSKLPVQQPCKHHLHRFPTVSALLPCFLLRKQIIELGDQADCFRCHFLGPRGSNREALLSDPVLAVHHLQHHCLA